MNIKRFTALVLSSLMVLPIFTSCENVDTVTDDTNSGIQNEILTENIKENTDINQETTESEITDEPIIEEPVIEEPQNPFASETIEQFYENAAFVGDSVMFGLEIYSRRKKTIHANATFLTLSSFAARHALSDVTESSYHPLYHGEKMKVEDALVLDGANKVFLFLGLNDVRVTPKQYFENYVKFIDCIKEKNPGINVFIISTTYPIKTPHSMSASTAASYRDQLKDLDEKLLKYCEEGNAYYIDVVTPLSNEEGFLADKYTSDKYVHLTNTAYEIWTQILDEYALSLITTGKPPVKQEETLADPEIIVPVESVNEFFTDLQVTEETNESNI